jgi:hypothetical protein
VNEVKKLVLGVILAAGLLASPAVAQSSSGGCNDVPDRFQIDGGYFRISAGVAGVADRGVLVSQLGGEITVEGVQVFASFRF